MYSEQRRYCPRRPTLGWIMTSEPGRGAAGPRRVTSLRRAGWRRAAGPGRPPGGCRLPTPRAAGPASSELVPSGLGHKLAGAVPPMGCRPPRGRSPTAVATATLARAAAVVRRWELSLRMLA
jgi:hypothetical protein